MTIGDGPSVAERLHQSEADLIVIVAPAGYGKTTLAEGIARRSPKRATFIAHPDLQTFYLRLLEALQSEFPERRLAIAESIVGASVGDLAELAMNFWSSGLHANSLMSFDNVEDALDNPKAAAIFAELLRRRPRGRRIVLCSRRDLPHSILRHIPPDRAEFVHAGHLSLGRHEIDRQLSAINVSASLGEAIHNLSRGWPIAVMLMIRLVRENRFDARAQATDEPYDGLLEHLSQQYLAALSAPILDAVLATVAVPEASTSEMSTWVGVDTWKLEEFFRSCPFVRSEAPERFIPHPLLIALVNKRYSARAAEIQRRALAEYRTSGEFLRSAAIEIEIGNENRAAADLCNYTHASGRYGVGESEAFVNLVSKLGSERWLTFPALWLSMYHLRRFAVRGDQFISEARRVYSTLRPSDPQQLRLNVVERYATILTNYGNGDEVDRLISDCLGFITDPNLVTRLEFDRLAAATHSGAYLPAQRAFRSLDLSTEDPSFYGPRLDFIDATIALRRGHYEQGVALLEESVRIARRSRLTSSLQVTLSNLILESWLAGDDLRFDAALAELKASILPGLEKPWTFLLDASTSPGSALPTGYEFPSVRCTAHLIIATSLDRVQASAQADHAVREADASGDLALRVISRVALAEIDPSKRSVALEEALRYAESMDLKEIHESVAAYAKGKVTGVFEPLMHSRLRRKRNIAAILVRMSTSDVLRGSDRVVLTTVEYALLALLAECRRPISRAAIYESLWPDNDIESAASSLKVYVHRLRKKLGHDVVVLAGDSYIAGSHVSFDLTSAESALVSANEMSPSPERLSELRRILSEFDSRGDSRMNRYDWYASFVRRSGDVSRSAALSLSRHFGRIDSVEFDYLRKQFDSDPSDDEVCEQLLLAYVAARRTREARLIVDRFRREALRDGDSFASDRARAFVAAIGRADCESDSAGAL